MTTTARAEEATGEIVPKTEWIVEEAVGISTMAGLELATKATDGVRGIQSRTSGEEAIAIGKGETP
jgi:hypothetical protein